jgi:Uma2 family endonuclease
MFPPDIDELERLIRYGMIRLEITGGIPTWEASPGVRHQMIIDQIRGSIRLSDTASEESDCFHIVSVSFRFPDGSLKQPDIAILRQKPPDQDDALTIVPDAVIEIISRGYEYKDVVINPPFYLSQGVRDVVIHDPASQRVAHYTRGGTTNHFTPVTLALTCGCECTIPAS